MLGCHHQCKSSISKLSHQAQYCVRIRERTPNAKSFSTGQLLDENNVIMDHITVI